MLKTIAGLVGLGVVVVLVLASRKPDQFRIERTATIEAPAAKIFPEINNLKSMDVWSPWSKMDPNIKQEFTGPSSGVGAVSSWVGNRQVGSGRMEITESIPNSKVGMKLDFYKPMKASHSAEFLLVPNGKATNVTWAMSGKNAFVSKIMCVFMNMDKMVGGNFETGLASLKSIVESKK